MEMLFGCPEQEAVQPWVGLHIAKQGEGTEQGTATQTWARSLQPRGDLTPHQNSSTPDKLRIQGPLGRVQSRLLPIITMFCLLLSLFSLPLCLWLLLNLFWSSRMIDQVCQIWRAGRNKLTHLNWYLHKISGYL